MDKLNEFFLVTLGWSWVYEYAALIIIVAAFLLLVLLITFIIVGVRHSKNKKKFKKMQAQIDAGSTQLQDNGELRAEIRAEMEPIIREQVEREYAGVAPVGNADADKQIAELNNTIREKDARIDELGMALSQANAANSTNSSELYRTINDLNQANKNLQNDVNILKAENAQLKANANAKQSSAARTAAAKTETQAAAPARAKKTAPVKEPEPVYDEDDDDDYYDDEFGDETSAVKVTLKYDRIKMNWVIYRSDTNRAYRRLATKQEAMVVAKDLARRLHAQLVVHKKDGKFQKI